MTGGIGLAGKVFFGTHRDPLHMIDVVYSQDGGQRPDVIVSDAGAYSGRVFGLVHLLDTEYRSALADLSDHKGRDGSNPRVATGLDTFARGLIDLNKIHSRWVEIPQVVVSIRTGAIRAYDVVTMLQREGRLSPLGEVIASYGRIFKTLHFLVTATESPTGAISRACATCKTNAMACQGSSTARKRALPALSPGA
jgi:TnpA family transposase